MNKEELSRIDHVYEYYQEQEGLKITFGWQEVEELGDVDGAILSFIVEDEGVPEEYSEWSKKEGSNVVSVDSFKRWIKAITGKEYSAILDEWNGNEELFPKWWATQHKGHKEDLGKMIMGISQLIKFGGEFNIFGRVYKYESIE